jgi:hypothetical protein
MLDKEQIISRIEWILSHKELCNKDWFIDELETLISSANSPETFESDYKTKE